jgi:hypothetical protein
LKKRNLPIPLKAAFLLIVFSMNMIIGFVCAVGMDMWFNTTRHHDTELMAKEGSHHHEEVDKHHKSKDGKGNCCNDHIIKFSQLDKSFRHGFAGLSTISSTTLISHFYNINVLPAGIRSLLQLLLPNDW